MVKLRLPKKVVIIASGVVVLTGASGATAFFIGRDRILGPSAEELSGVACTDVIRVADMRRDRAPWLRKYVKVPPGTDGMTRVKTAIRVAKKVQESLPADLIEIAVLDEAGPDKRAFMRGRAVGAEVILVKDPAKVPGITQPFTVQYYQGGASGTGMFYGEGATMTSDEAEKLLSQMKDLTDCAPPPGKEPMADAKGEKNHEKKPEKKAEKPKKEGGGHEGAKAEGGSHEGGAKEAKPEVVFPSDVFGKMQKAAFDKAEEAAAAEEEAKHEQEAHEPGFMGKMLGMVGLGGSKDEASSGHEGAAGGSGHEAPAEGSGHGDAAAPEHGAATEGNAHGASAGEASGTSAHGASTEGEAASSGAHDAAAPAAESSGGFLSKMMGMVGLGKEKPKDIIEHSGGPAIVSGKKVIQEGETPSGADAHAPASAEGHAPADAHAPAPTEGHAPAEGHTPADAHAPADAPTHSSEAAPAGEAPVQKDAHGPSSTDAPAGDAPLHGATTEDHASPPSVEGEAVAQPDTHDGAHLPQTHDLTTSDTAPSAHDAAGAHAASEGDTHAVQPVH